MTSILGKLLGRKALARSGLDPFNDLCARAAGAADMKDLLLAIQLYDQAIGLRPDHAEAHYKRANALRTLGRLEEAITGYDRAIERNPGYAYAYCNRGVVQQNLGMGDAALASFDQAIALDAGDAMAHYNRALLLQEHSQWDAVLASYDNAIAIDPAFADAQYNRSLALLYQGDFERGWRGYEWRWKNALRLSIGKPREFTQPLWRGEPAIAGQRLLLYCEGGLGDTIQFCRYAASSAARGAGVILEVQPPLLALLADLEGVSQLIGSGDALPPFDYQCPLMSLPLAFQTTLDTIPAAPKYLRGDRSKVAQWRALLGDRRRPRVGLAWSGNPNNTIDHRRSIRLADWVAHLPRGCEYFCLQNSVRETDAATLDASRFIRCFGPQLLDFANTAALCECMDVVVSVDTSLAHLSGALAQRTWVLLPFHPDWRWLRDRDDSPWYPTMRLYRQRSAGDWNEVFDRVAADLRRLL